MADENKVLAILAAIQALAELSITLPALVGQVKATLKDGDRARVEAALADLQARNDALVPAVIAELRAD